MKVKTGDKVRFSRDYEGIVLGHRHAGDLLVLRTDKGSGGWGITDEIDRFRNSEEIVEAKKIVKKFGKNRGWWVLEESVTVIGRWRPEGCEITGRVKVIGDL